MLRNNTITLSQVNQVIKNSQNTTRPGSIPSKRIETGRVVFCEFFILSLT
jgi:hypothetical protein